MKFKGIIIHHTDSLFGTAQDIEDWHKEAGYDDIGYHATISNGLIDKDRYVDFMDGSIEIGRDWDIAGAHALGYNDYFGVVLVGVSDFTEKQFNSLLKICRSVQKDNDFGTEMIKGHNECEGVTKSCPNWNVQELRDLLSADKEVWYG